MNLLKRYESDDFDESYAFDDAEYWDLEESGSSKPFLVKAIAMILAVTGIAYGANIALTPSGSRAEFGQGFITTTACDTNGGITIIPYAGFINDTGTGEFTLDSIILENVHQNCVGDDFIIKVWSNTDNSPLVLSDSATGVSTYQTFTSTRFFWSDSVTVRTLGSQYTDVELLNDTSTSTDFTSNQTAIQITFDPDTVANFADAKNIYKITLETAPNTGATS